MQVTDPRFVAALTALAEANVPADVQELLVKTGALAKSLTAALSDKQAGEVTIKPLSWVDHPNSFPAPTWDAKTPFGFYNIEEISASDSPAYEVRLHAHHLISIADGLSEAKAAAQADYEQRIRSALVDVPAVEPVAKQWCAYENDQQYTSWYPDGYGDRVGWEALAKRNPAKYRVVTRDLFTSPPLREGEASAEVFRSALQRIRELTPARANAKDARDIHLTVKAIADAALAATRSGSATTQTGGETP